MNSNIILAIFRRDMIKSINNIQKIQKITFTNFFQNYTTFTINSFNTPTHKNNIKIKKDTEDSSCSSDKISSIEDNKQHIVIVSHIRNCNNIKKEIKETPNVSDTNKKTLARQKRIAIIERRRNKKNKKKKNMDIPKKVEEVVMRVENKQKPKLKITVIKKPMEYDNNAVINCVTDNLINNGVKYNNIYILDVENTWDMIDYDKFGDNCDKSSLYIGFTRIQTQYIFHCDKSNIIKKYGSRCGEFFNNKHNKKMMEVNLLFNKWHKTTIAQSKNIFKDSEIINNNMILFEEDGRNDNGEIIKEFIDHTITYYTNELAKVIFECNFKGNVYMVSKDNSMKCSQYYLQKCLKIYGVTDVNVIIKNNYTI